MIRRTNALTNPSFEVDTAGVTRFDVATLEREETHFALAGTHALAWTLDPSPGTFAHVRQEIAAELPEEFGKWVGAVLPVRFAGWSGQARAAVARGPGGPQGSIIDVPANTWVYPTIVGQVPGADPPTPADVMLHIYDAAGDAPPGDAAGYTDAWITVVGDTEAEVRAALEPYFDGDTPGTALLARGWAGPPHASTSVETEVSGYREVASIEAYVDFSRSAPGGVQQWTREVLEGRVTVDASWTPAIQAEVTCVLDEEVAAAMDPTRTPDAVQARIDFLRDLGLPTEQQQGWDLEVREVRRNYAAGTMTVVAMSAERIIDTYVWTDVTPRPQLFSDLDAEVHSVLVAAGRSLEFEAPVPYTIPEDTEWLPGQSAGDYLRPILDSAGYKLLCDGDGNFGIYAPNDVFGPGPTGPVTFTRSELIQHEERASQESHYADDVLVIYEDDSSGTIQRTTVTSSPSGALYPTWHVERVHGKYPGPGASNAIRDRLLEWRHERTISTLWNFDVRPGIEVFLDLPTGPSGGYVHSVTYHADGTMDIAQSYE